MTSDLSFNQCFHSARVSERDILVLIHMSRLVIQSYEYVMMKRLLTIG